MKSFYAQGLQASRQGYWMGQSWLSDLFKSGGAAYSSFEQAEAAEDTRKAAEANRAAAASQAATAATNAAAAAAVQSKIMGIPAGTFWLGAAGLGILGIVAAIALKD